MNLDPLNQLKDYTKYKNTKINVLVVILVAYCNSGLSLISTSFTLPSDTVKCYIQIRDILSN